MTAFRLRVSTAFVNHVGVTEVKVTMEEKSKVLVIEDSVQAREALCAVLEAHGFDVRCCEEAHRH